MVIECEKEPNEFPCGYSDVRLAATWIAIYNSQKHPGQRKAVSDQEKSANSGNDLRFAVGALQTGLGLYSIAIGAKCS